jgi:hypothetical protein
MPLPSQRLSPRRAARLARKLVRGGTAFHLPGFRPEAALARLERIAAKHDAEEKSAAAIEAWKPTGLEPMQEVPATPAQED